MAWNGSGTFNLDPAYSPESNGTVIDAARYNGLTSDIATGISNCLAKDGQNVPTANIPMGGFKLTGLAAGSAAGNSVRYEQANVIGETTVTGHATAGDIFAAATARVLFTGTGLTVTAFPASSLNTWKLVRFDGINTITHSASLVCPGALNITTAAGDYAIIVSVSSTAVIADYFPYAGRSQKLSSMLAATATNTIANGAFTQTWNWTLNANDLNGLYIGETAVTTALRTHLLRVASTTASRASPFLATWGGSGTNGYLGFNHDSQSGSIAITARSDSTTAATGSVVISGATGYTSGQDGGSVVVSAGSGNASGSGGTVAITGGTGTAGGNVNITGGTGSSGNGGTVKFQTGKPDTVTSGAVLIDGGPLAITANSTAKPSVTGAGTGAAIVGSDGCFTIDVGTSPTQTFTVTFSRPMGASGTRPRVFCQYEAPSGSAVLQYTSSVTTTGFVINFMTANPNSSGYVHCLVIPTSEAIA